MTQRGFAGVSGAHFTLNDQPFYFAGANNYYLIYKSEFMINSVLDMALAMGLKVVRSWASVDRGSLDGSVPDVDPPGAKEGVYFHYWDPSRGAPAFNDGPDGLQRLDLVVHAAGQRGLKLILPLVNNWQPFGGIDQYVTWYRLHSHHEFYTHPDTRDAYKNWALHLLNRRNVYSGALYKDDPTIFAWELANEPRCQGSIEGLNARGCGPEVLIDWVREMSAFLEQHDSRHMVTVGDEGFFRRTGSDDWLSNGSQGVDFDAFLRTPSIDFGTVHLYPDTWDKDAAWGTQWIEEHIAAGVEADKPVIIEEYGWKEKTTRDGVFRAWLNAVERRGGAADLIWMLGAQQDDGSLYPDYDHYTIYGSAGAPAVAAHAAVMESKSGSAVRIDAVTSAASYLAGAIAPGEVVTLFGSGMGPDTGVGATLNSAGLVTTFLAGTRVLVDGIPSPLIYAQAGQANVVVPHAVSGRSSVQVRIEAQGQTSNALTVPVAQAAPGVFTLDSSGTGQAAVLNQDNSLNSAANPAPRGSIISLFATGTGQTDPPGIDGKPAAPPLPAPVLSVTVEIAGAIAEILYAGGAPGLVAGVLQANVRIPEHAATGSAVPLVLRSGGAGSQPGVTIAIV
jgi:uncharacterized protein (TIGR03437 family)